MLYVVGHSKSGGRVETKKENAGYVGMSLKYPFHYVDKYDVHMIEKTEVLPFAFCKKKNYVLRKLEFFPH